MSKALTSSKKDLDRWLGYQLNDHPDPANHPDYTTLLGGRSPLKSVRETLEALINQSNWSRDVEHALDDLGVYFQLPDGWWKNRDGLGAWLLHPIAAAFADAWIYQQWLRRSSDQLAGQFAQFFAESVLHPEWVNAVDSMWLQHYPLVGGNLFEIIPRPDELIYPKELENTPWHPKASQKIGKELIERADRAKDWLISLLQAKNEDKGQLLEAGLNHISFAAIKGDQTFFIALGRALSEQFEPPKKLSLEEIQNQPTSKSKKEVTTRQWCRRMWISRGLWLIPPHILQHEPFSLSQTAISELTGSSFRNNKRVPQNDGLYRCNSLWFNEWQDESKSISLTSEGKKLFPEFSESGLPWSIVSLDFE